MADPCDVCGAAGGMRPLLEAGLHGVGAVWVRQCAGCGFRQVRPRLPPAALDALYGADYFDSASAHGFAGYARQRQRYERDAYFLARELRQIAPAGRFLEVGSALGFLLAALDPLTGWEVEGVEVSRFGAWYARDRFGAAVRRGTLEEAGLPSDAFDYVLQKDLLEHVTHPRRHLEETRRIMRRGGRLRVVTPNGEADLRPLGRTAEAHESDELPLLGQGHLSFFSRAQLLRLFEGVGFRVLRLRSIGIRRGLRALGLVPGRRSRAPSVRRQALALRDRFVDDGGEGPPVRRQALALRDRFVDDGGEGPLVRRQTLVPRDRPADGAAGPLPASWREQAARIDAEVAAHHRWVRGWRLYFHYRRLAKRLDALPGSWAVGQDFDVLVEKR